MSAKDVAWLGVGLWWVPTLAMAAEAPIAVPPSTDQAQDQKPIADSGLTTAATVKPLDHDEDMQSNGAKPVADASSEVNHPTSVPEDTPAAKPEPAAAVTRSNATATVSTTAVLTDAAPVESSTTLAQTPKLYGEPDSVEDLQPSFTDPLEQLSTEEWLDLISDPVDAEATANRDLPEQPNLQREAELSDTISSSNAQPAPNSVSPLQELPQLRVSQSAADLISPALTEAATSSTVESNPQLNRANRLEQPTLALRPPQFRSELSQQPADRRKPKPAEIQAMTMATPPVGQALRATDDSAGSDAMAQVTSVSQLSDVQPTDWAYQALQSLVERYGVIEGYPDGLFRGERALTRYEFAAGVNAAMDRLTQLVASSTEAGVSKTDLDTIKRLQDDFLSELSRLRGRVDGLEARVAELSANQFSTTVVLNGQVTFGVADAWGGDPPGLGETNPVFAYLTQLQLSGSFSERDAFRIDFDAGNFEDAGFAEPEALNTQMALMGFQTDTDNTLELSGAEYRVAVSDRLVLTFKPVGFSLNSVLSPNSIYSSVSQGALSRFAAETPIFRIGSLDSGMGLDWLMTDRLRLQVAYGARDASDPIQGLLKSDHRALGVQLLARPFGAFTTGIAYVNAFADDGFLDTFTGSNNADISGGFLEPAAIHAISGTFQWQVVPSVVVGAWGGLTVTDSLSSNAVAVSSTYLFSLGFPDTFGREGDLLGIMVGQPLRLRYGLLIEREDEGSGLHYEIFYRIRINDNIAITPGVFVVTDPGHIPDNDTIIVGALRTSFSF